MSSTSSIQATIVAKLKERLQPIFLDVRDTSGGCGASFDTIIVSEQFEKMTTLARHRLVHETLAEEIKQVHAFSQKSYTPSQWKATEGQT